MADPISSSPPSLNYHFSSLQSVEERPIGQFRITPEHFLAAYEQMEADKQRIMREELVKKNLVRRAEWAKNSPFSYKIHQLTEPFFKAIMPSTTPGLAAFGLSGCMSAVILFFSSGSMIIPAGIVLYTMGLGSLIKQTENARGQS